MSLINFIRMFSSFLLISIIMLFGLNEANKFFDPELVKPSWINVVVGLLFGLFISIVLSIPNTKNDRGGNRIDRS